MSRATLSDIINRISQDIQENTSGDITATTLNELLDYMTNNLYLPTDSTVTVNATAGIKEFTFGDGLTVVIDEPNGAVSITNPSASVVNNGASFSASCNSTVSVPVDSANPAFLGPFTLDYAQDITLVNAAEGIVRNDSGRVITMSGSINYNPDKGGGGVTTLNLVSERSADNGTTWTGNLDSKRTVEIANTSESFQTLLSWIITWNPGELLRFRAWISGGTLNFVTSSDAALGQTFTSPSVVWILTEM